MLEKELYELKLSGGGDSVIELQYKLQIQRMEEEHKSFL
jgi:hypothetical protein